MDVAFLGLGRMGVRMAAHVAKAGHPLTVWNRSPGKAGPLRDLGATEAGSVAEAVADADAVVLMLANPDAVRQVAAEVRKAARPGTLVIDCSTVGPDTSRAVAADLGTAGVRYVDAPVAGSLKPAADGTLGVFVGGAPDDVAEARPLLELWGDTDRIVYAGGVGGGQALKVVMNLGIGVAAAGVGESLRLARYLGIDQQTALDALAAGPLGFTVNQKREMVERGDYSDTTFSLELLAKDLGLCLASAESPLRLTGAALGYLLQASAEGLGGLDYAALIGYVASGDSAAGDLS
jgi:3-hydroxyisobutyrate dehydrogenase